MTQVLLVGISSTFAPRMINTLEANGWVATALGEAELELAVMDTPWALALVGDQSNEPVIRRLLKRTGNIVPTIVIAENPTFPDAVRAIRQGAYDYLPLPIDADHLMAAIERALIEQGSRQLSDSSGESLPLIGDSPCMQELRDRIAALAATDRPVLIMGEPGCGKRLVARSIHDSSDRQRAPMVAVNCAAIPPNVMETELFGRDSSLGGQPVQGLVSAAHQGTLFLDEIGVLTQEVQARLLRLLRTGELRAVGSSISQKLDVRIVASSHRDLEQLSRQGLFRNELLYQLSITSITIPPLRDRGGDIVSLARWFLAKTATRLKRGEMRWSEQALACISRYRWPGNVRELENAVERAIILAEGDTIPCEVLPIDFERPPIPSVSLDNIEQTSLEDYFVRFVVENEEYFSETELAEKLGISRKSLWERRQRLNIPRKKSRTRDAARHPGPGPH